MSLKQGHCAHSYGSQGADHQLVLIRAGTKQGRRLIPVWPMPAEQFFKVWANETGVTTADVYHVTTYGIRLPVVAVRCNPITETVLVDRQYSSRKIFGPLVGLLELLSSKRGLHKLHELRRRQLNAIPGEGVEKSAVLIMVSKFTIDSAFVFKSLQILSNIRKDVFKSIFKRGYRDELNFTERCDFCHAQSPPITEQ